MRSDQLSVFFHFFEDYLASDAVLSPFLRNPVHNRTIMYVIMYYYYHVYVYVLDRSSLSKFAQNAISCLLLWLHPAYCICLASVRPFICLIFSNFNGAQHLLS